MDSKYGVLKFYYFFTRLFFENVVPTHFKRPETEAHKKTKAGVIELVMMFYQAQKTRFLKNDAFTKLQLSTVKDEILNSAELKASNEWLQTTFETTHQEQICIMMINLFDSGACVNSKGADFSDVATVFKNPNAETYIKTMVAQILFHPFIDFGCDEDDEVSRSIFEALKSRVAELDALYLP
jgi:hypothetical protein